MTAFLCAWLAIVPDVCELPVFTGTGYLPLTSYPAVMVIYDPRLGGINCDGDCLTVATGPLTEDMYFTSGACHQDLLGATVHFPAINFSMRCVDTGGLIDVGWNEYYQQEVLYFDAMWDASNPPPWVYWLLDDWEVVG